MSSRRPRSPVMAVPLMWSDLLLFRRHLVYQPSYSELRDLCYIHMATPDDLTGDCTSGCQNVTCQPVSKQFGEADG